MTTIIFGILGLLVGVALAVSLGLVLYKDKSKEPVAHSKVMKLSEENQHDRCWFTASEELLEMSEFLLILIVAVCVIVFLYATKKNK